MEISLYNNHEQYIKENNQNWAIAKWCLKHGVPIDVIEGHPQFKDVVFLLEFRTEFEKEYKTNRTLMSTVNQYWNIVYNKKKPLKLKAFVKFEIIATQCLQIRQQLKFKRQVIQQIRQRKTGTSQKQNIDQDNKANGSCLPSVTNTKREQQECRVVPERVWEAHELWW